MRFDYAGDEVAQDALSIRDFQMLVAGLRPRASTNPYDTIS